MEVSIILPTYNEKANIVDLVRTILSVLQPLGIIPRVIVVDDNSPDGTADLIRDHFSENQGVRLILRKEERGLATAIATGIEQAQTDLVVVMDTDFNHHPKDLPQLLAELKEADMVIGSRYVSGGGMKTSRFRYLGSWVFNVFIRVVLGSPVRDNLSGFLVLRKEMVSQLKKHDIFYGYGDYCIRLIHYARKAGFVIRESPVVYEFRLGGESKTNFAKYLVDYIKATLALRFESR